MTGRAAPVTAAAEPMAPRSWASVSAVNVENPLGLMRAPGERLAPGGRLLVETYGIAHDGRVDERATIEVQQRGGIYPGDEFVYWGFGAGGLTALAGLAGFAEATIEATPTIDGHPRVLGALVRPGA